MTIRNLVLESGGISGICLVGAVKYLQESKHLELVNNYIGSSAGAILASLLSIGYRADEIIDVIEKTDFGPLLNDNFLKLPWNLIKHNGLHSASKFVKFMKDLFKKKGISPDITFSELYKQNGVTLVITGTSLSTRDLYFFNRDSFPNMPILYAMKISMSIPFYFTSETWVIDNKKHVFTDGAVLLGYPLYYFDVCSQAGKLFPSYTSILKYAEQDERILLDNFKSETLGILILGDNQKMDSRLYHGYAEIKNIVSFGKELVGTFVNAVERENMENPFDNNRDHYWNQTIAVIPPYRVDTTNFNLDLQTKKDLITKSYTDAKNSPIFTIQK